MTAETDTPSDFYTAFLSWPDRTWRTYAMGFKEAADVLVDQVVTIPADFLILPIGFLYRHYVELQLKMIAAYAHHLLDEPAIIPRKHDLTVLWSKAREVCERAQLGDTADWFERIDSFVSHFNKLDSRGQAFRYPTDSSGAPTLREYDTIDIRDLAAAAKEGADLLDGLLEVIGQCLDGKYEMRKAES